MSEQRERRPAHEVILDILKFEIGNLGEGGSRDVFTTIDTLCQVLERMVLPDSELSLLYLELSKLAESLMEGPSADRLRAVLKSVDDDYTACCS